jgi:hypothetical protein
MVYRHHIRNIFIYKISPLEKQFKGIISFLYDLKIPSSLKENVELYKSFQCTNSKILPIDMDNTDKSVLRSKIETIFGDFKMINYPFGIYFFGI